MAKPMDTLRQLARQAFLTRSPREADAPAPSDPLLRPWLLPAPDKANHADILACFRLILGRNPHREEWPGHSARAGEPLAGVVASYVNSLEFSRRGLLERNLTEGLALAALPGFRIYTADDDAAVGLHVRANNYEADVTAVFRRFIRPGMNVIDIGANIGYFTMLSASLAGAAGSVLAVEPNPRNARLLEASRRANGFDHVTLAQVAAGARTGLLVLHASYSNGTTSAPSDDLDTLLGSETVPCVRVDSLVEAGREIGLIKLDVEGFEYQALEGCERLLRDWRPVIVSEFSPDMMKGMSDADGPEYLRWIIRHGYDLSVIEPDGSLLPARARWETVMEVYGARGTDHVDLVATPV